jgi:hypothetical protein
MFSFTFEELPRDILRKNVSVGNRFTIGMNHLPVLEKILEAILKKVVGSFKKNTNEGQTNFLIDFTLDDNQPLNEKINRFCNRMREEISQIVADFSYQPQFNYHTTNTAVKLVEFSNELYAKMVSEILDIKNGYR